LYRAFFFSAVCLFSTTLAYAQSSCSAYGDPPATLISPATPACKGAGILGPWNDSDGTPRYACMYRPRQWSTRLPLIVFLHPAEFTSDHVDNSTNLLDFIDTYEFGSGNPGFVVLAPQGRDTTHYYFAGDRTGTGWDNWYRQLRLSPAVTKNAPLNVDAETIDHFISLVLATEKIDRKRIYLMGWSNGGAMTYLYGLNRKGIASIAVYSAPDPWADTDDPCEQIPVRHRAKSIQESQLKVPSVPTYQVHNGCDLASLCPNAERMMRRLRNANVRATDQIIGLASAPTNPANQQPASECFDVCGTNPGGDGASTHMD
jgi:poly(3-hydroxybutyrate) depolymerase